MLFSARLAILALTLTSGSLAKVSQSYYAGNLQVPSSKPVTQSSRGEPHTSSTEAKPSTTGGGHASAPPAIVTQIPDGQLQVPKKPPPVQSPPPVYAPPPGLVPPPAQAPPSAQALPPVQAAPPPVHQIPDGQLQVPKTTERPAPPPGPVPVPAPAHSAAPSGGSVSQIPDGQPQAPAAPTIVTPGPPISPPGGGRRPAPSLPTNGNISAPSVPSPTYVTANGLQLQPRNELSRYAFAVVLAAWAWGV